MSSIDPAKAFQAFADLGVYPNDVRALERLPFPEAQVALLELKERARRNFRRLSLELHPDRNGGNEALTERFKVMSAVRDELEKIEVHPAPAPPRPVPAHPRAVNPFPQHRHPFPFGGGVTVINFASSTSATGAVGGWVSRPIRIIIR